MGLTIDRIQELIDSIDYVKKPYTPLFKKNEDGIYTMFWYVDECLYRGQAIVDNIIPFYINNVRNTQLYNLLPYDSIKDETWGLYLGIPYYKVITISDKVCEKWLSSRLEDLRDIQNKIERERESSKDINMNFISWSSANVSFMLLLHLILIDDGLKNLKIVLQPVG